MEADKAAKRSAREAALKDFNLVAESVGVEPANLRWLGRTLLCIGRRINNRGGGREVEVVARQNPCLGRAVWSTTRPL